MTAQQPLPDINMSSSSVSLSPSPRCTIHCLFNGEFKPNPDPCPFEPGIQSAAISAKAAASANCGLKLEDLDVGHKDAALQTLKLTVFSRICQAEWVFYENGRVKLFGSRPKRARAVKSSNKDDFGSHYIASRLLNKWLPGWELRDDANKQLCMQWVKDGAITEMIPRPGRRPTRSGVGWADEEVALITNAALFQGWDNSENPDWKPNLGTVSCEPKDHDGRVVNCQAWFR